MPGIILTVTLIIETGVAMLNRRRAACLIIAVVALAIVVVLSWAFQLADSRGALVGLVVGLSAAMFFALRGRARSIPVLLALAALVCAWLYHPLSSTQASTHGRDTSVRLRLYAWEYAWDMFNEKPLTGYGQGGFVLTGDARAVNDVLNDPLPFEARIAHVHNEWLEVLADLGSVGFALIAAALALTLRAGMTALKSSPPLGERWALIGLMGALVGLTAEEAFGVGLRVSGVPTMFYTVLGLIWALSAKRPNAIVVYLAGRPRRRVLAGIGGIAAATAVMAVIQNDFLAARNAHGVVAALQSEDFVDAAAMADDATKSRLNPQRTLENLARLSEAQMLVASVLQRRAIDRETRGNQSDLSNPQLLALAEQDRAFSHTHSKKSSEALKELVARSPSYFNHGRIEYELNLIQAANATARNDREEHDQCLKNAAAAIERELLRRPFNPSITLEYLSVAGDSVDLAQRINILARPLRHHRIATPYVDFLAYLTTVPGFEDEFTRIVQLAHDIVTTPPALYAGDQAAAAWAPEKLRLAATIHFRRGNYGAAREALEIAARSYDALAASAPMGAASCYAELADCQFFAEPDKPHAALDSALRAISLAPQSLTGRRLKRNAGHRMVDYYLAAGQEDEAQRLLGEFAPPRATDDAIRRALGFRYRAMCEALRDRRLAQVLRKPINELLPQLQRWAARAIELNPDDHLAHYLATDLAFHAGDCDATGKHLQLAIENGLEAQSARQFVRAARDKRPGCSALDRIWTTLAATGHSHVPVGEPPSTPAESPSNSPAEGSVRTKD